MEQKKGIELVEPNENLSVTYIREADDTIEVMNHSKGTWINVTGYYACYHGLYAILMKCGIKCETHDCTIALMGLLGFDSSKVTFMKKLKEQRIEAQYYLRPTVLDFTEVKQFLLDCKGLLRKITENFINDVRDKVKNG